MEKVKKIGVQLYTIRNFMQTEPDIEESFKKIKALGYDQLQTAGCTILYERFGELAEKSGLEIIGTHDDFEMMYNNFPQALKNHQALKTYIMGHGGEIFKEGDIVKRIEKFIEKLNAVGEKLRPYGGKMTFHNHHHEFIMQENGKRMIDMLVEGLNPETTAFVLDTFWVQRGGGDVRHWIEKLSGRIEVLHLKDYKLEPDSNPIYAEVGSGNLYWEGILESAQKAGVKYYIVEQDRCPGDPFESLKMSSEYLHEHFM